jgi:hypothetical protein
MVLLMVLLWALRKVDQTGFQMVLQKEEMKALQTAFQSEY